MTRGRLIFPFVAEIRRTNPRALALDPGLDGDFKEPALVDRDEDGVPDVVRAEHEPVHVPCQVEPKSDETLRMFASGNSPKARVELLFHFADLERLALVDDNGEPLLRAGDRLTALYTMAGELAWRLPEPGLFGTEISPLGFGLPFRAPRRNLLLIVFEDRSSGAPRGGM